MRRFFTLVVFLSVACSTPRPEPKAAAVAIPADQSRHFPIANQTRMDLIPNHLLGKTFMPGGNLATYRKGKVEYEQFLGKMPDAQAAAFLLLDWKRSLADPQYLAHMGGYFGTDIGKPLYVFTKSSWVAGVVGLPRDQADVVAREFAAHL